jgi:hypothetical protein
MSNVIDFLERMGRDAQLRHASKRDVELGLTCAQIDPDLRIAILAKDQSLLEALLGQETRCCMQMPGKEDEDEEESPSRDGDEISAYFVAHAVG